MEFQEVLRSRRSVRSFQERLVDHATVERLIDSAILAPSAMNSQPWQFWVALGRDRIDQFADRAKTWLLEMLAHNPTGEASQQRQYLSRAGLSLLYHAPALVLVVATSDYKLAEEDCCLAANSLMLAARDAGLGSCWIGFVRPWFNLPLTKRELGIPDTSSVVAPIVLGYPTEWPVSHRRNLASIHWIADSLSQERNDVDTLSK